DTWQRYLAKMLGKDRARQARGAQSDGLRLPRQPGRGYRAAVLSAAQCIPATNPAAIVTALALVAGTLGSLLHARAQIRDETSESPARLLAAAGSWGYQLQNVDPDRIAATTYDMLVVDYSRDGSDALALTPEEVGKLKV